MEKDFVIACDVDGVINAFGDENFSRSDMQDKMLYGAEGNPRVNLTFSPTAIDELNSLAEVMNFFMLTSWNERVRELQQAGLACLPFLMVNRGSEESEKKSKIQHIIHLASVHGEVLWIDDFAEEWFSELPETIQKVVHPIQTHHLQGFEAKDFAKIMEIIQL